MLVSQFRYGESGLSGRMLPVLKNAGNRMNRNYYVAPVLTVLIQTAWSALAPAAAAEEWGVLQFGFPCAEFKLRQSPECLTCDSEWEELSCDTVFNRGYELPVGTYDIHVRDRVRSAAGNRKSGILTPKRVEVKRNEVVFVVRCGANYLCVESFDRSDFVASAEKEGGEGQSESSQTAPVDSSDSIDVSPPKIVVTSPPRAKGLAVVSRANLVTIEGFVTDESRVTVLRIDGKVVPLGAGGRFSHPVHFSGQVVDVRIYAEDEAKNSSLETFRLATQKPKTARSKPVLWLVAVGISKYKNSGYDLEFGKSDAKAFVQIVQRKAQKLYERIEVSAFHDSATSAKALTAALGRVGKQAAPEDVFIFYYSGHGVADDSGIFWFVMHDVLHMYRSEELPGVALSFLVLQQFSKKIRARKQLIVIDACQAGAAVELASARGAAEEKALAQLAKATGTFVLVSARKDQQAVEHPSLKSGLFTHAVLRGLEGAADGSPRDGKVTALELSSYVVDAVPLLADRLAGTDQFPNAFNCGDDFPVVLVEE